MKTMGLIGGMSWESSLEYYRIINTKVKNELGGLHSAKCILYSVDFEEIEVLQHDEKWDELTRIMIDAAKRLEQAGVDLVLICSNTMHKLADEVQKNINIPLLNIADATAQVCKQRNVQKLGLLGTRFTMEQDFYRGRLADKHNLDIIIPEMEERKIIHSVIYNELCLGKLLESSKQNFIQIIDKLLQRGADGIILGCTEIPLLVKQKDISVPLFNTTTIHAEAAVMTAISVYFRDPRGEPN